MVTLIQQMDALQREYGRVEGSVNTTGALNLLLDLRGVALYEDFYEGPELAEHLVRLATEAIIRLERFLRGRPGLGEVPYMHPNCSNVHLSRAQYVRFLRPADVRLSEALPPFGIHQCGNADELIAAYAAVPAVSHVDVQATTDRRRLAAAFPDVSLTVTLSPILMRYGRPARITRAVREIAAELARPAGLKISAPALDHGTPDRNVRAFLSAVRGVGGVIGDPTRGPPTASTRDTPEGGGYGARARLRGPNRPRR